MVTTKFMENLLKNKDLHLLECEIEYKEDEGVYCSNSERNLCICNNNIDYIGIEKNIYFDEFDVTVYLTDNSFNSFTCDINYIDLIKKNEYSFIFLSLDKIRKNEINELKILTLIGLLEGEYGK